MTTRDDFFHGGHPGLDVGDWIECPDVTGTDHRLSRYVGPEEPFGNRTDVVYVTTNPEHARVFAAVYPDGAVYRVKPEGEMSEDPDNPGGESLMARRAQVVEVVRERVVFAHRTIDSWLRLLR